MSDGKPVVCLGDIDTGHGKYPPTPVTSGSPTMTVGGKPVARVGDTLAPHHPGARVITKGDPSVLVDGKPIAIIGSAVSCGGTLATGNGSVVIGGSPHVPGPPTYTAAFDEFLAMMFNPETNTFCPEEREALLDSLNVKYEPRFPGDTVGQLKPEYRETETLISSGSALTPEQVADNLSEDLTAAYTQKVNDKNLESIDILVKDADGNPAGGLPYYAFIADESERDGRLNAEGKSTETGLPPGRVIVHVGGDPNGNEIRQFDAALRDRLQLALQQEKTEAKRLSSELAEKPALSRQWAYQKAGVRGLWNGALGLLSASSAATVLDTYQQAVSKAWSLWRYTDDAPYVEAFTKSFSGDPYKAFVDSLGIQVLSVAPEQLAKIGEQMIFLWEDHGARSALKKFINDFQNAQDALNLQGGIEATDDELAADLLFSSLLMHAGAKLIIDASSDWETHLSGIGSQLTHLASALKVSRQRTSGVGFTPGRVDISLVRPEHKVLPAPSVSQEEIHLSYTDAAGNGIAGAQYIVEDLRGNTIYQGTLDDKGEAHIENVSSVHQNFRYRFDKDPLPYEPKIVPAVQTKEEPGVAEAALELLGDVGNWIWGTVQGDFNEKQTTSQLVVNTIIGLIPIADQVLDIRDLLAGVTHLGGYYMEDEASQANHPKLLGMDRETRLWLNVFIIALGCIPVLGSVIKGVLKGLIKKLSDIGAQSAKLTPQQLKVVWEELVGILNTFGQGNAHKWLKELKENFPRWMDEAAAHVRSALDTFSDFLNKLGDLTNSWFARKLFDQQQLKDIGAKIGAFKEGLKKVYGSLEAKKLELNNQVVDFLEQLMGYRPAYALEGAAGRGMNQFQQEALEPARMDNVADDIGESLNRGYRSEMADGAELGGGRGYDSSNSGIVANDASPSNNVLTGDTDLQKLDVNQGSAAKFGPQKGKITKWGAHAEKLHGKKPPNAESPTGQWHGHHTVHKAAAKGTTKREYAEKSKEILEKYDIDWYRGPENVNWAPHNWKGLHTSEQQKRIYEALKEADEFGGDAVKEVLKEIQLKYRRGELF